MEEVGSFTLTRILVKREEWKGSLEIDVKGQGMIGAIDREVIASAHKRLAQWGAFPSGIKEHEMGEKLTWLPPSERDKEQDMTERHSIRDSKEISIQAICNGELDMTPKKTYTPTGCLVALHPLPEGKTPGGLEIPETVAVRGGYSTTRCKVIAVGKDVEEIKVGQIVLVFQDSMLVVHKGYRTAVLREDQICGIEDET